MIKYDFPQSDFDSYVQAFGKALDRLDEQADPAHAIRAADMHDAMTAVLALWLLSRHDDNLRKRFEEFSVLARRRLTDHPQNIAIWLGTMDGAIWQRDRDGWYYACQCRSAAEVVNTAVDDGSEPKLVDSEHLEASDIEMRASGPALNALPPRAIPTGIPASHWWWRLPQGPDASDKNEAGYAL